MGAHVESGHGPAPAVVITHRAAMLWSVLVGGIPFAAAADDAREIHATPADYLRALKTLKSGDRLVLAPGIYDDPDSVPGLPVFDLHGDPERPIVITGPESGAPAVLRARATHNTVRIERSSYVMIRNIELDGRHLAVDGIKAQQPSHHITIENLDIHDFDASQQNVGISTKAPAWNWTLRGNKIHRVGTGMYLGNSDGTSPFIAGLIENNTIRDTIGYNVQIKHQGIRPDVAGLPSEPSVTILRHNLFSKSGNSVRGSDARPNVLLGHFPPSGPGVDDVYLVYGNRWLDNSSRECLLQGEGNIAMYNNLLINRFGSAICIQPHNAVPRDIHVFHNTVVAAGAGIRVRGGDPAHEQRVDGNAIFAAEPLVAARQSANVTQGFRAAPEYLTDPFADDGNMNLRPKGAMLAGEPIELRLSTRWLDADRDFDGRSRDGRTRGAFNAVE